MIQTKSLVSMPAGNRAQGWAIQSARLERRIGWTLWAALMLLLVATSP